MKKISILFLAVGFLYACTENFDEININPDRVTQAGSKFLIGESQFRTIDFLDDIEWDATWVYSHYFVPQGGAHLSISEVPTAGGNGDYFNKAYVNAIVPLQAIIDQYGEDENQKNRVAMAKIWRAYVFSTLVSLWGPVPYSEASQGLQYVKYDSEEYIYYDLLDQLKTNADILSGNKDGDNYDSQTDFIFGGDIDMWVKFAHSLRFRITASLYNVRRDVSDSLKTMVESNAMELLDNPELMISSNSENVSFRHIDTPGQEKRLGWLIRDGGGRSVSVSEVFMGYMRTHNDPRLRTYATGAPNNSAEFIGRPINHSKTPVNDSTYQNNPHSGTDDGDYSRPGTVVAGTGSSFRLFHYDEICFLKAEMSLLLGRGTDSEQFYLEGINAAMAKHGIEPILIEDYLAQPGVALNTRSDPDKAEDYQNWIVNFVPIIENDLYQKIVAQMWLASYPEGVDMWAYLNRTDFVQLSRPVYYDPSTTNTWTKDLNCPMPYRFVYPLSEFILNEEGYSQGIQLLGGNRNDMYKGLLYHPTFN